MTPDRRRLPAALAGPVLACTTLALAGTRAGMLAAAVAATTATGVAVAFGWRAWAHERARHRLRAASRPAMTVGTPVRLLVGNRTAFVAGLWAPDIFCSSLLVDVLDPSELQAVILHEQAHQQGRDPARLTLLAAVAPLLSHSLRGAVWMEAAMARLEIRADRYALDHGATRQALASSLLKVAPSHVGHAPSFASAVDRRLEALLGGDPGDRPRTGRWVLAGVAAGAVACAAWLPVMPRMWVLGFCCG
ncbi:MAG TPA: M48 family metalloprotease [Nitriliruptorales bacterium]